MTLSRRIAVLLVTVVLSGMGAFATTAFIFDDAADAVLGKGPRGPGTP